MKILIAYYSRTGGTKKLALIIQKKLEEKKSSWKNDLTALIAGELPDFDEVKKEILNKII